ncbi:PREDICTED: Retrovirus-related Pol poly from, partial [Prunus dulcis]
GRGRGRFHSNSGSQFHSRNHPFPGTNNSSGRGLLPTPSSFFPGNTSNGTNSNGFFYNSSGFSPDRSMTCQICERKGHSALTCRQRLNLSYNANVVPARFQAPSAHYAHSAFPPTDNLWLADSGASNHVTSNMSNLGHSSPYTGSETLRVGDGNSLPISHTRSTILHTSNAKFHLLNVLHVPQVAHNLLSVHKFVSDNHCSLIFDEIGVSIKDNATQRMLYQGPCEQGLYPIYCSSSVQVSPLSSGTSPIAFLVSKASIHTWHKRLGHPHSAVLKTIVTSNQLPLEDSSFSKPQCTDCILGKATRLPFTPSFSVSTTPLELVHSDVWGPSPIDSCTGYRYYVLFLDDYTKHVIFHEDHFPFTVSSSSPPSSSSSTFQFPINLTFLQSSSPTREVCTSLPPVSPSSTSPQLNFSLSLPAFPLGSPSASDSPLPSSIASLPSPAPPPQNTHSMVTRSKNGITKPKALFATQHPISSSLDHLSLFPTTPTTYKQAVKSKVWQDAMQAEFDALLKTNTWTLVPPSSSQNIVGCKWVYRIKHTADDVSNAFLHGSLKEDVFMEQPPGFLDSTTPHYVCKLNRSLYGLKQAPRAWYEELFHSLLQLGFRSSQADSSLFIKSAPSLVFILVYVDDILVTGPSSLACHQVIKQLSSIFPVKDLGPVHYFLGLEVHRSSQGLALSQTKYAYDLLQRTDFLGAKPCSTPLGSSKLDLDSPALSDPTFYRSTVGALQYLTWTRPDLAFAVNQVCQHMHNPRESHLAAVKRILRYLKGTLHLGL